MRNVDSNYLKNKFPQLEKSKTPASPSRPIIPHGDTHPIDQKQFALMFGDTFISKTPLEGGQANKVMEYYSQELSSWETDPAISQLVSKETIDQIKHALDRYKEGYQLLLEGADEKLKNLILNELARAGHCTIPVRVEMESSSHVFSCVIEKNREGELSFYFINRGDGSSYHPVIKEVDRGKKYVSYRSATYVIKNPDFFLSEEGSAFVKRLVDYTKPPSINDTNSSEMVYEDLTLFADEDLTNNKSRAEESTLWKQNALGVTPQRSGTCPEHAARLMIRDELLRAGLTSDQIRLVMFLNKWRGLNNGYQYLPLQSDDPTNSWLLLKAAEGVSVQALKLKNEGLIEEAFLEDILALVEAVKDKANTALEHLPATAVNSSFEKCTFKTNEIEMPAPDFEAPREIIEVESPIWIINKIEELGRSSEKACRSPADLIKFLQDACEVITYRDDYPNIIPLITSLLLKAAELNDSFWRQCSRDEAGDIIINLVGICLPFNDKEYTSANGASRDLAPFLQFTLVVAHKLLSNDPYVGPIFQQYKLPLSKPTPEMMLHSYHPDGRMFRLDDYIKSFNFIAPEEDLESIKILFPDLHDDLNLYDELEQYLKNPKKYQNPWKDTFEFVDSLSRALSPAPPEGESKLQFIFEFLQGVISEDNTGLSQIARLFLDLAVIVRYNTPCDINDLFYHTGEMAREKPIKPHLPRRTPTTNPVVPAMDLTTPSDGSQAESLLVRQAFNAPVSHQAAVERLLRLRYFKETRIPLLIDWCRDNSNLLHIPEILNYVEECLFTDKVLEETQNRQPLVIRSLMTFLNKITKVTEKNADDCDHLLALNLLEAHVESHLNEEDQENRIQKIQFNLQKLNDKFRSKDAPQTARILAHQLYIYSLFPETISKNPTHFLTLLTDPLLTQHPIEQLGLPSWMDCSVHQVVIHIDQRLPKNGFKVKLHHLNLHLDLKPESGWEYDYPFLKNQEYTFDIFSKKIFYKGEEITTDWPHWMTDDPYLRELSRKKTALIRTASGIKAIDGTVEFHETVGGGILTQQFQIGAASEIFTRTFPPTLFNGLALWKSVENPERCITLQGMEPNALLLFKNGKLKEERIEEGKLTGSFAVSWQDNPSFDFLNKIPKSVPVRVFSKKDKNGTWCLSEILIGTLRFQAEHFLGKTRMKSLDIPNLYLAQDQWMGGLWNGEALWLESGDQKNIKALLFSENFIGVESIQACTISQKKRLNKQAPLLCDFDAKKGSIHGETVLANLAAIKLYIGSRRYEEAFNLLEKIDFLEPPNKAELEVIHEIISSKNEEPAATALKLRVEILKELAIKQKVVNDLNIASILKENTPSINNLLERYKSFIGSSEIYKIPAFLRLKEELIPANSISRQQIFLFPGSEDMLIGSGSEVPLINQRPPLNPHELEIIMQRAFNDTTSSIDLTLLKLHRKYYTGSFGWGQSSLFAVLFLYRKTKDEKLKQLILKVYNDPDNCLPQEELFVYRKALSKKTFTPIFRLTGTLVSKATPSSVASSKKTTLQVGQKVRPSPFAQAIEAHANQKQSKKLPEEPSIFKTRQKPSQDPLKTLS